MSHVAKQTDLDTTDQKILRILTDDARLSIAEISEQIHLSPTPTIRRIKRLEDIGVITGYHAATRPTAERFYEFESRIQSFDEVVSCSVVTGRSEDYLLKVLVKDMRHYEEFLLHRLSKIEGVSQLHTSFVLREVFHRSAI